MSKNYQQATLFFEACETGKGWEQCKAYCHAGATFSAQSGVVVLQNGRVFFGRVKIRRFYHPGIEHVGADIYFKEFLGI